MVLLLVYNWNASGKGMRTFSIVAMETIVRDIPKRGGAAIIDILHGTGSGTPMS